MKHKFKYFIGDNIAFSYIFQLELNKYNQINQLRKIIC